MPLILLLLGLLFPRVVIFILWLFTTWFSSFNDWVLGILGFLFMPFTLLWYTAVLNLYSGTFGFWQTIILLIAVIVDLSELFSSWRVSRGWYYS